MTIHCGKPMRVVASTVLVKVEYCFACKSRKITRRERPASRPSTFFVRGSHVR